MEITTTEIMVSAGVLILALVFYAIADSSGQPEKKDEDGPQILDEDDFDE
jgi:hypothetical protein